MRNIPGKTLVLIAILITLTVVLLGIAISIGRKSATRQVVTLSPTPQMVEKTAEIYFSPSSLDLSVGSSSATVDIIANTGKSPVTGVQVDISYNPSLISNVRVLPPDDNLSLFGPASSYTTLFTDTKTPGKVSFALGINPTDSPKTGKGSVGKISFSVVKGATPTAELSFGEGTIVTSKETQESILDSTFPLTIKLR